MCEGWTARCNLVLLPAPHGEHICPRVTRCHCPALDGFAMDLTNNRGLNLLLNFLLIVIVLLLMLILVKLM